MCKKNKKRFPLWRSHFGEIEPWPWLRHITPWWFLHFVFNRYHVCWSNMVMWKMGYGYSWDISRDCLFPHDYCGYYDHDSNETERLDALKIINDESVMIEFLTKDDSED